MGLYIWHIGALPLDAPTDVTNESSGSQQQLNTLMVESTVLTTMPQLVLQQLMMVQENEQSLTRAVLRGCRMSDSSAAMRGCPQNGGGLYNHTKTNASISSLNIQSG